MMQHAHTNPPVAPWLTQAAEAALRHPGVDAVVLFGSNSSTTCARCGHVDTKNREGKTFRCTGCGHADDADVNAGPVGIHQGHS